jgi:ribosomal-protein-alanine N-acetyltransferase
MSDSATNDLFTLESLTIADAPGLHELMVSNKNIYKRFLPITLAQNKTIEASVKYILDKNDKRNSKTEYIFGIKSRANNTLVGLLILKNLNWGHKRGELAYCIDEIYQGRGWTTKAIVKITSFALNDLGLKTLRIIVHKENRASMRVAEKCGFLWKKTLLKSYTPTNEESLDMELYEKSDEN